MPGGTVGWVLEAGPQAATRVRLVVIPRYEVAVRMHHRLPTGGIDVPPDIESVRGILVGEQILHPAKHRPGATPLVVGEIEDGRPVGVWHDHAGTEGCLASPDYEAQLVGKHDPGRNHRRAERALVIASHTRDRTHTLYRVLPLTATLC